MTIMNLPILLIAQQMRQQCKNVKINAKKPAQNTAVTKKIRVPSTILHRKLLKISDKIKRPARRLIPYSNPSEQGFLV